MGVIISATNSGYDFPMGYSGFFNLRKNIALALDKSFGEHYANLIYCHSEKEFKKHDEIAEWIININGLDKNYSDVLDFLYASDCDGSCSYKTCGKIYNLIKDIDFKDKGFCYATYSNNDYERFKKFLKECYSKRRKMRWE